MGKRRRASISGRGGVTAVSLKDAVRSAEAVLNDTAAGGSGGSSVGGSVGVLLGAAAGGGKKKTKRKGKKGGKHANTMLIRAHHTVNQQLATAREEGDLVRVKELETIVGTLGGFDMYATTPFFFYLYFSFYLSFHLHHYHFSDVRQPPFLSPLCTHTRMHQNEPQLGTKLLQYGAKNYATTTLPGGLCQGSTSRFMQQEQPKEVCCNCWTWAL